MTIPDSPSDLLAGFIDDYFAECDEHLTLVREILVTANADAGLSAAALEELFRSFHSVKGLSGMVELREAELVAHHMENFLRVLRSGDRTARADGIDALIQGTQLLEQVIAARRNGQAPPPIQATLTLLDAISATRPSGAAAPATPAVPATDAMPRWVAVFAPSPALAARGINVDFVRSLLRKAARLVNAAPQIGSNGSITFVFTLEGEIDETLVPVWAADGVALTREIPAAPAPVDSARDGAEPERSAPGSLLTSSQFVRVDLAKLDELMRMIGDLVISRARLEDTLARVERHVPPVEWREVEENGLALERHLRDLRDGVMRVRLVPVGEIFRRMSFVVRDLARESGRQLDLQINGQDTAIDKYLIERMMDPILHLVRNAASHGIEPPAVRIAAGKLATGRVTLGASSVGDVVTIEVSDDGRGIDGVAVARRAREVGMAIPDGPLEGAALLDVLCAPGFSTRESADLASGRGVGMNVVQSVIRELGGSLSLDSAPGEGTRFVIELPLTLAITDAIVASVGTQLFAVPQSSVREVIAIDPASLRTIENHEVAVYRGGLLPIVRLATMVGADARPGRALHVFVIGQGLAAIGVAVDRIKGQREIVVRPLTDTLIKVDGVTGATDLGNGQVVLILDLTRLVKASTRRGVAAALGRREAARSRR